jgi:DNA-binding MarR family transcriptional regulator
VLGIVVIALAVLVWIFAVQYTNALERERNETLGQLMSMPQYANCNYDAGTCPQAVDNIVLPDLTAVGIALLIALLGIYLVRQDHTSRSLASELKQRRTELSSDARWELISSVLTQDERSVVEAVRAQPGISQATLRLRTGQSKAKLSTLLAELERRGLVARTASGKTNEVHLRREL